MASDKVRFGIVGVGGMGSGHCGMMGQIPEAQLAAVCDVNPTTREAIAAKYGVPAFRHPYEELLGSGHGGRRHHRHTALLSIRLSP